IASLPYERNVNVYLRREIAEWLAIARQVVQLHQLLDNGLFSALLDALWDTVMQMLLKEQRFKLLNGFAHRVGLAQNIDTILIGFHHLANPANVALDIVQALEGFLFICAHV